MTMTVDAYRRRALSPVEVMRVVLERVAAFEPHIRALYLLAPERALADAYPIDEAVGHEQIAPGRKHDPGAGFDWARLARALRRRRPRLAGLAPPQA